MAARRGRSRLLVRHQSHQGSAVHEATAVSDPGRFRRVGEELRLRVAWAAQSLPRSTSRRLASVRSCAFDRRALRAGTRSTHSSHRRCRLWVSAILPVVVGTGRAESVGFAHTRLTMPFNATGQPVLALPCAARADAAGLPVGLQLAGRPGDRGDPLSRWPSGRGRHRQPAAPTHRAPAASQEPSEAMCDVTEGQDQYERHRGPGATGARAGPRSPPYATAANWLTPSSRSTAQSCSRRWSISIASASSWRSRVNCFKVLSVDMDMRSRIRVSGNSWICRAAS